MSQMPNAVSPLVRRQAHGPRPTELSLLSIKTDSFEETLSTRVSVDRHDTGTIWTRKAYIEDHLSPDQVDDRSPQFEVSYLTHFLPTKKGRK